MDFMKKLLIIPPIIIGGAIFMFMQAQKKDPQIVEVTEVARHVRVVDVQEVRVKPKVHGFGTVRPAKTWVATAQVSGEIVKVSPRLKKGAILKAGTVIVTISPVDFELAIAQSNANIRATDAKIDELGVSGKNTQDLLDIEKQSLQIREGELARQEKLVKNGTVSRASYDRERRDTFVQRKKVQELENTLRLIPTQLSVQQEQRAVYMAQLRSAELNLQRTKISLPFEARFSEVNAEVAQFAQQGQTLAKADGIASAEIEAQVPIGQFMEFLKATTGGKQGGKGVGGIDSETLAVMIANLGMEVKIFLNTGSQRVSWNARLARFSDTIDPKTRTIGIIAIVDDAYRQAVPGVRPPLAKGLFVEMEITSLPQELHLIVPRLALNGKELYILGKGNRLEVRTVETGLVQGDFVVITKGLRAGDQVVVSDLTPAIDNMLLAPETDGRLYLRLVRQAIGTEDGQ